MRKLIVNRGASGSGKSTFLHDELGLEGHVVSMDEVKLMMGAPVLDPTGRRRIDNTLAHRTFPMMKGIFSERLGRGETLALDLVNEKPEDMDAWLRLAREARYEILVVDFGDMPLERCLAQNARRPDLRRVPEDVVRRQHANVAALRVEPAADLSVVRWDPRGSHVDAARRFIDVPTLDLSAYDSVVHVGDLQGCLSVLAGPDGPLARGLDPRTAYVFVGDLLDRGIENDQVLSWWLRNGAGKPNAFLVWGNHEDHIARWAAGLAPVSDEFRDKTLPQLQRAGLTPEDGGRALAGIRDGMLYEWRGHKVMVTHAGLPTVPERLGLVSLAQLTHGVDGYDGPVDEAFDQYAPAGWVQVHGHRNPQDLAVQASPRSFNLENKVEFGGNLRLATLSERGWETSQHRNRVFAPAAERRGQSTRDKTAAPWVGRADGGTTISGGTVNALRAHKGVRETRAAAALPHVSSFAFTKQVFYDAAWDDVVVKARGLYVDTSAALKGGDGSDRYLVVARGYDKFWNLGEREDTDPDAWAKEAKFPITGYLKENGFLGILSVDPRSGDLFIASKSKAEGPFAGYFRDILHRNYTEDQLDRIRRWLVDNDACMTFEVIDPVNDPHIVEYDREGVVLLDVFRRAEEEEVLPYAHLQAVGQRLGLEVKQRALVMRDEKTYKGFINAMSRPGALYQGAVVEGFVFEDANGRRVKLKGAEYSFWKRMRGAKERIVGQREGRLTFDEARYAADPRAAEVTGWMRGLSDAELAKDIISLRKAYVAHAKAEAEPAPAPRA